MMHVASWLAVTKGVFSEINQSAAPFAFGLHAEAAWTPVSGAGGFPVDHELTVRSAGIGPHVRLFICSSLFISPNYNSNKSKAQRSTFNVVLQFMSP